MGCGNSSGTETLKTTTVASKEVGLAVNDLNALKIDGVFGVKALVFKKSLSRIFMLKQKWPTAI
jgi:hypothetical protein